MVNSLYESLPVPRKNHRSHWNPADILTPPFPQSGSQFTPDRSPTDGTPTVEPGDVAEALMMLEEGPLIVWLNDCLSVPIMPAASTLAKIVQPVDEIG